MGMYFYALSTSFTLSEWPEPLLPCSSPRWSAGCFCRPVLCARCSRVFSDFQSSSHHSYHTNCVSFQACSLHFQGVFGTAKCYAQKWEASKMFGSFGVKQEKDKRQTRSEVDFLTTASCLGSAKQQQERHLPPCSRPRWCRTAWHLRLEPAGDLRPTSERHPAAAASLCLLRA